MKMKAMKDQTTVSNAKDLAYKASELLDSEVKQVFDIIVDIQARYATRANTADNLESMRDEALTRLMDIGVLATVDPTPCFYGDPPVVEIIGKVDQQFKKFGLDHEQKGWEINKAHNRGEDFYGEKEKPS